VIALATVPGSGRIRLPGLPAAWRRARLAGGHRRGGGLVCEERVAAASIEDETAGRAVARRRAGHLVHPGNR